jgi:succinate-acetate transporter protein
VAGIAAFTGNLTLNNVGGWLLEATGVGRLSLSAATLINEMYCRRVLPVI